MCGFLWIGLTFELAEYKLTFLLPLTSILFIIILFSIRTLFRQILKTHFKQINIKHLLGRVINVMSS